MCCAGGAQIRIKWFLYCNMCYAGGAQIRIKGFLYCNMCCAGGAQIRIKGFLYFHHSYSRRWLFHYAGRQRYDLQCDDEMDLNSVGSGGVSHLVLIGHGLDQV